MYGLLTFGLALLLKVLYYWQPVTHQLRSDDFGTLIYPAQLGGYNWTTYITNFKRYYGYGYYWIFTPLFKWIHDPTKLLAAIVLINAFIIALFSILIYELFVRYASFPRKLGTVFFAVASSMFLGMLRPDGKDFIYRTDNEIPLYFGCWLMVWILLAAHRNYKASLKKRILIAVGASVLLSWILSVHERALALVMAVFFAEFFLYFAKRKWLFQPAAFFGSFAAGFMAHRLLRRFLIHTLWLGNSPKQNTSAFTRVSLWFLDSSFRGIKTLFLVFIGNLSNFMTKGFGLPALAMVIVIVWGVKQLPVIRKKWFSEDEEVTSEWVDPFVLVMLVFGLCIMIVIAGLAVRWGSLLYPAIRKGTVSRELKGVSYTRYYYDFVGPVVFGVFAYCYHNRPLKRGLIEAAWYVFLGIELVYFAFVFPYLTEGNLKGLNFIRKQMGVYIIGHSNEVKLMFSMTFVIIAMVFLTFGVLGSRNAVKNGRKWLTVTAFFIFFLFLLDRAVNVNIKEGPSIEFVEDENASAFVRELIEDEKISVNIYLPNSKYVYPFLMNFPYYGFYNEVPTGEKIQDNNLILFDTNKKNKQLLEEGYEVVDIGFFTAYTNDPAVAKLLMKYEDGNIHETAEELDEMLDEMEEPEELEDLAA